MNETGRSRNRREFRLENLEGRNLLSVFRPTGVAALRDVVQGPRVLVAQVRASLGGSRATDPFYGPHPTGYAGFSGHGTASPFGGVLVGLQFQPTNSGVAGTVDVNNGSVILIMKQSGNQLRLAFTGTNHVTTKGSQTWYWTGNVVGGTGRFLNASGTFIGTGTLPARGQFQLNLNIAFNPSV